MKSLRTLPALAGCLMMLSSSMAQELTQNTPPPQRWTGQANTIVTPTASPSKDLSFPSLAAKHSGDSADPSKESSDSKIAGPAVTITSSLAIVLGLFAAMVWMTRRFGSRGMNTGSLPREVLQSLGSSSIDPRTRVSMLRCGNRILVVAQTGTGIQPLAEIDDPEEVRQLTAACLGDSHRSFVSTLESIEKEPVQPGFVGNQENITQRRKRSRLFATA